MAIQVLQPLTVTSRPVLLFSTVPCGAWVQLQIKGAGTATIARQSQELLQLFGNVNQGLDLTANAGVISIFWIGQCFAIGSVSNVFIDVQVQVSTSASQVGS